jgi:hypothetical protein
LLKLNASLLLLPSLLIEEATATRPPPSLSAVILRAVANAAYFILIFTIRAKISHYFNRGGQDKTTFAPAAGIFKDWRSR